MNNTKIAEAKANLMKAIEEVEKAKKALDGAFGSGGYTEEADDLIDDLGIMIMDLDSEIED